MFCCVFLGDAEVHPATYEVCSLLEERAYAGVRLRSQTQRQPTLPVALLCLLQTEFTEGFRQVLERRQRVLCQGFERLRRDLVTGNIRLDSAVLPGVFMPHIQSLRAPPVAEGTLFATPYPAPPWTDSRE